MIKTGTLQIRPFVAEDVLAINLREPDRSIAERTNALEAAKLYEKFGPAFTGLIDGVPLAAAGLTIVWPGCAIGWAFTGNLVPQHALSFHRAIKKHMLALVHNYALHRIHVEIPRSHHVSRKWIVTGLGFQREGLMRKYGSNKEDFIRYVRFFGN